MTLSDIHRAGRRGPTGSVRVVGGSRCAWLEGAPCVGKTKGAGRHPIRRRGWRPSDAGHGGGAAVLCCPLVALSIAGSGLLPRSSRLGVTRGANSPRAAFGSLALRGCAQPNGRAVCDVCAGLAGETARWGPCSSRPRRTARRGRPGPIVDGGGACAPCGRDATRRRGACASAVGYNGGRRADGGLPRAHTQASGEDLEEVGRLGHSLPVHSGNQQHGTVWVFVERGCKLQG